MKKRLITLLIAFVMMFSLVVPAYATEGAQTEDLTGGLDFYSITINYTKDILVDYTNTSKSNTKPVYQFQDAEGNKVMADKVVLRAGVTKNNDFIGFDKSKPEAQSNFYQLDLPSVGINATATSAKFPYEYAYITHIQNGVILKTKTAFSFYGIFAPYDEGEAYKNQNPNVVYNSEGYALDVKTDDKGNNYYIDINEYQVGPDGLWYDNAGNRVELFHEIPVMNFVGVEKASESSKTETVICQREYTDDLLFSNYDLRIDSKTGKIKKLEDLRAYYYISKADLVNFFKENKDSVSPTAPKALPLKYLDPSMENYDAELEKILKGTNSLSALERGEKFNKNYFYIDISPSTYRVVRDSSSVDAEGNVVFDKSKKMSDDLYSAKDTKFTQDYIARDSVGNRIYSTPVQGTPKLNVEIESISVEIDAMGTQLYDNASADPQAQNKITVSINDFPQNITLKEQALADKWISQNTFDSYASNVLATVSSKTTSTAAEWDASKVKDGSYKSTVTSIDLGLSKEDLNKLPLTATIFLSFDIKTTQADGAYNAEYTPKDAAVTNQNAKIWEKPAKQESNPDAGTNTNVMLFVWIGVAAVAVIAIVVILVLVLKKKKK
ncbi:MAG: hypothetical protein IKV74_07495 [Clostridia bacterium]|nr:hypothetical protein [Clostridia bacterium]